MSRVSLGVILVCAALLRFWALNAGVPYSVGADEPEIMTRVDRMLRTGDLNPHFFDYPTLFMYVELAVASVRFMAGATMGYWSSLEHARVTDFYLWARAVTACVGTATVWLVYLIGTRWGTAQGLIAAAVMTVMPIHVRESHFVLTDVPATFIVTLTCVLALRASEHPTGRRFIIAGAAAGFAAATKYPAALALVLPLGALALTPEMRGLRIRTACGVIAASGVAFLIAAPYTILDLTGFLNGYAHLMASYTGKELAEPGWITYLKHLRLNLAWPAALAVIGGFGVAAVCVIGGPRRTPCALVACFPLLFFWLISGQALIFGRYLLPLVPFLSVLAALGIVGAAGLLPRLAVPHGRRRATIVVLTAIVIAAPAAASVSFNLRQAKRSTAAVAYEWMLANIPPGASIVSEGTDLTVAHMPYRSRAEAQLRLRTYEQYVAQGVDYLVASSQRYGLYLDNPGADPEAYQAYMRLFAMSEEVARFTPDDEHPGAELRVLKVKR